MDSCCFYPCEIILYPYQPVGKIKNEQLHAGRASISDIIVMLKLRHHVAYLTANYGFSVSLYHVFPI